ncbi:MAG TPA: bifunctional nuclease domain-containing protein [Thermoanaerobaculia bacterium]|nr:bifunctional nuclease domain-containing protein [Thermoanaerobaculia bacterium]
MLRPRFLTLLLAVAATACSSCSSAPPPQVAEPLAADAPAEPTLAGDFRTVEVATVGWDGLTAAPVVLLRDLESGQLVPIWVGVAEAQAIAAALHEVTYPRPMTHDLMSDLLAKLDARLDELLIHDLVGGTYYGMLRLVPEGNGGHPLLVDTRPSDGMALALRTGATIRIAQRILDDTPDVDFMAPDEPEQVVRALGLTVVVPTAELRAEHALPERPGLLVVRAVDAAAEAGLHRGDLLLSVGGLVVERPVDLLDAVRDRRAGEAVTVRYWRDGEEHEASVRPKPPGDDGPRRTA